MGWTLQSSLMHFLWLLAQRTSLFPVTVSCAGLAISVFSLLCLFTDTPPPASVLAPLLLSSPGCSLRRRRTLWDILQCLLIPNIASSLVPCPLPQMPFPSLYVLSIPSRSSPTLAQTCHLLEAFPQSQLKVISLCLDAPQPSLPALSGAPISVFLLSYPLILSFHSC